MRLRAVLLLAFVGLIATGCDRMEAFRTTPGAEPFIAPLPDPPSPESLELTAYYARVEQGHRARGLLRTDGGGPDTPYDSDDLARAFTAIAFAREFSDEGDVLVRRENASFLHRWESPVLIQAIFGNRVSDMQRAEDSATIQRLASRLQKITGHPVRFVDRGGNFQVLILHDEERRVVGPRLTRLIPGIRPPEIQLIEELNKAEYCIFVDSDPRDDGVLTRAVAIIRAELPPLLRLSCIHEEISQGLGLANDSDHARPSIFNDGDEFARLTGMDEKMLQLLYDLRLRPGMDAATAAPIVESLAQSLAGQSL